MYAVRWSRSDIHTTYIESVLCMVYLWYAYDLEVYHTHHTLKHMLCWRFTIHNTLSNICFVGGSRCCVGGLPYTTHFQIYVLLEVVDVVLEVYHTHHTLKHMLCWRFTIHHACSNMLCVNHFSTIVMLVVHTHNGI